MVADYTEAQLGPLWERPTNSQTSHAARSSGPRIGMAMIQIIDDPEPPAAHELAGGHDICHRTGFCRRCGLGEAAAHDRPRPCRDDVIAISHIVARRWMDRLARMVLTGHDTPRT